eukprot:1117500-Rhodomonas_salina.2
MSERVKKDEDVTPDADSDAQCSDATRNDRELPCFRTIMADPFDVLRWLAKKRGVERLCGVRA